VVADLTDVARLLSADAKHFVPALAFQPDAVRELPLIPMSDVQSAHYLRLRVADEAGVLSRITAILAAHDISVEAIIQREPRDEEDATIAIITSVVQEKKFNEALAEMQKLPFVHAGVSRFRVEHFND
jgi:homoserine dehydrogenase